MSKLFVARLGVLLAATAVSIAGGWWIWQRWGRDRSMTVTNDAGAADQLTWRGMEAFVVDPVAGLRPRSSATIRLPRLGMGDPETGEVVKHRDSQGFLREHELPQPVDRPCVLVVGDSHIDGVVSTDENVTALLERQCETDGAPCYVLNAACGQYSLWQSVLRARDLLPQNHPRVVVLVVFLGNDFLDLENPTMPHLDDDLNELPEGELDSAETTRQRARDLALPQQYEPLFWQGLDQALFLDRNAARIPVLLAKAAHAVDVMIAAAAQYDARLIWCLLPSFDLVFPAPTAALSELAQRVVEHGAQRRLRDAFAGLLSLRHATVVDFEPAFRADGGTDLYASDFHVYRRAHQLMAAALHDPVLAALR